LNGLGIEVRRQSDAKRLAQLNLLVFNGDKRLTDDALAACEMTGVEPDNLLAFYPKDSIQEKKRMNQLTIVGNYLLSMRIADPQ
jgi:hypothetical protein